MKTIHKSHFIKCINPFFTDVKEGRKPFEFRFNDRNYQVGDEVYLQEYNPETKIYSGHEIRATITYVLKDFAGIKEGYCIFGIKITQFITKASHE